MDNKYYYLLEGQQYGPFGLEEFRDFHLPPDIMVWYEGMANWQPANTLPELQDQYQAPPQAPPIPPHENPYLKRRERIEKTRSVFRIIVAVIFTLIGIVGIAGIISSNSITAWFITIIFLGIGIFLFLAKPKKNFDRDKAAAINQGMMMGHMMNMDDMDFTD